jgi:predicted DsbA family dithiol-disulfide isomerase
MKVDFYSDIACVWCYISMHRLERALAEFPDRDEVQVVHRAFQLDPSLSTEPKPHLEFLDGLFGPSAATDVVARVTQITGRDRIPYDPRSAISVNTLLSHRLLLLAGAEYGLQVQSALKARLYGARFAEGGNVGDLRQLADMAVAVGMDRARVLAYLATDQGTREVREDTARGKRLGVTAVPTFVFDGKWSVTGLQEKSTFLTMLEQATAGERDAVHLAGGSADAIHRAPLPLIGGDL